MKKFIFNKHGILIYKGKDKHILSLGDYTLAVGKDANVGEINQFHFYKLLNYGRTRIKKIKTRDNDKGNKK